MLLNTPPPPPNQAPSAVGDAYTTGEDTTLSVAAPGVLANDRDSDGDPLTASLVSGPAHGSLTLNANGSFSYTPAADYNGPDSFTYRANDGSVDSNTATVSLTVTAVNDAPTVTVAAGGSCGTNDRSGTINLIVADVDNPAAGLTLSRASDNQALVPNANVAFAGAGANRTLTATAVSGRTGSATLTVTVSDGTATGTVTATVRGGATATTRSPVPAGPTSCSAKTATTRLADWAPTTCSAAAAAPIRSTAATATTPWPAASAATTV